MEKNADMIMYAYLSKDDDKWDVTIQFYNMSTEVLSHDQRIYRKKYDISNPESLENYDKHIGQAVYGELQDDKFYISSIKVDSKNYNV